MEEHSCKNKSYQQAFEGRSLNDEINEKWRKKKDHNKKTIKLSPEFEIFYYIDEDENYQVFSGSHCKKRNDKTKKRQNKKLDAFQI